MDFKTLGQQPLPGAKPMTPSGLATPADLSTLSNMSTPAASQTEVEQPGVDQMPSSQGIPGDGSDMATEEQKAELIDLLNAIQQKQHENESGNIASKNTLDNITKELLSDVFQILRDIGVDLSDQASIDEFLTSLEASSPDLYQIFVEVLDGIMDPEMPPETGEGMDLSQVPEEQPTKPLQ